MEINLVETSVLNKRKKPFCPGCSYHVSTNIMGKAVDDIELNPLDTILVSDIGCCGILDPLFNCHTVHGLHGRAVALASGISLANENPEKKIIVVQGDGGATIGMHHLLEAARRNLNMTLLVKNNMVYGMTGGQESGLSASTFTPKNGKSSSSTTPFNICGLAQEAGAAYVRRVKINNKELKNYLSEAINTEGFAIIEILGVCPSYGMIKVSEIDDAGVEEYFYRKDCEPFKIKKQKTESLFTKVKTTSKMFNANIDKRINVLIAGGAGQSIQSAAEFLGSAALLCGLEVSKRGDYPITVGTGFSNAEVIISNREINYNGIVEASVLVAISPDGLKLVEKNIVKDTLVVTDNELEYERENIIKKDFLKTAGKKGAAIAAIAYSLVKAGFLPIEAFYEAAKSSRFEEDIKKALSVAEEFLK